jgi:hypothetical protein
MTTEGERGKADTAPAFVLSLSAMKFLLARSEAADKLSAACTRAVPILEKLGEGGVASALTTAMYGLDAAGEDLRKAAGGVAH